MSLKEKLAAHRGRIETISTPELGEVRVRRLTADEVFEFGKQKDTRRGSLEVLALTVKDESGQPLFASWEEAGAYDWAMLKPLMDQVLKINRLDAKDAEKNSPTPLSSP